MRLLLFINILFLLSACTTKHNDDLIKIFVSSAEGDRMTFRGNIRSQKDKTGTGSNFKIDTKVLYQTIDGFGASFNEAGMICLNSLSPSKADSVISALFDTLSGAGFSLMKAPLAACDFSSAGMWYSYNDTPGDTLMTNFSIERDLKPDGIIPYIRLAKKHGNFKIHSTMDFPPVWMLYGLDRGKKHVKTEYYRALARYYGRYIKAYMAEGIRIDYLSPFNEPDNSWYTNVTYPEISDMIKHHIVPFFKAEGIEVKIQAGETVTRSDGLKKLPLLLADRCLAAYISTVNVHGYDWNLHYAIDSLHKMFPDIPVWMSEVCYATVSNNVPPGGPEEVPVYGFSDHLFWTEMIINDMKSGASGWIYWNMILDENGGPWLFAPEYGNPDNNRQHPVVVINRRSGEIFFTGLYYSLAHFSRLVRPGASRIGITSANDKLNGCAFINKDGTAVLVVLNKDREENKLKVSTGKMTFNYSLPPESTTTFVWKDK